MTFGQLCAAVAAEALFGSRGLGAAALGAEFAAVDSAAAASPAACWRRLRSLLRSLLLHLLLLHALLRIVLHILRILHVAAEDVAAHILRHAHAEERVHRAALVVTCRVDAFGDVLRHISLLVRAVAQEADGSAHLGTLVDDLLALVAVFGHAHGNSLDLKAALLTPLVVERVAQILCHLLGLGGDKADAVAVRRILVERGAQLHHEFLVVLLEEFAFKFKRSVLGHVLVGNDLLIELERIGDLDRIGTVQAHEQLRLIEHIVILNGAGGAELDVLDLFEVDVEHVLRLRGHAAVFDTRKALLDGIAELSVEQRGHGAVVYLKVARLCGVVNDLAAVHQNHHLLVIDMDDGAVGNDVGRTLFILAFTVLRNKLTGSEYRMLTHRRRLDDFKPSVSQAACDSIDRRSDNTHSNFSFSEKNCYGTKSILPVLTLS